MIKADPCFGAWHMINSSATDLKADEDAFAKLPNANMQHQQRGPNPPNNQKVASFLGNFREDDLKDKKYRFPVISLEEMLSDKLCQTSWDLIQICHKLEKILKKPVQDMQDMLTELDSIIQRVRILFYGISSSSIDCDEDDDFVTEENDDPVFELNKPKDNAFISREVMLIDKLCEASGDLFKIYHKLLIIRKDILKKPVEDMLV
ncbi:unnamed protein product [Trifolium pratense]|uniref:Uncharacterized protein n=1 Tax=Trifolium pratense TaxID=57577 RepID=A0ACB0MDJ0_TRIPR|nr:unnamed protein product [Trifolium pratense]